jgi:hypothetical protein
MCFTDPLLGYDNQNGLLRAQKSSLSKQEYDDILSHARRLGRELGIDRTLKDFGVDVILGPGDGPLFYIAGIAGKNRKYIHLTQVQRLNFIQAIPLRVFHLVIWTSTDAHSVSLLWLQLTMSIFLSKSKVLGRRRSQSGDLLHSLEQATGSKTWLASDCELACPCRETVYSDSKLRI